MTSNPKESGRHPSVTSEPEILKLLRVMASYNASDLHLKHNRKPIYRVYGHPVVHEKLPALHSDFIKKLFAEITPPSKMEKFEKDGTAEFSLDLGEVGRYRINIYSQRGYMSASIRLVNSKIPSLPELNLPDGLNRISEINEGLVLVAGVTGSGKSTTLAALVEHINQTQSHHIITFEDPIEYVYEDKKSFINQREIGSDMASFNMAIKYVLRQDPDIILIGELRDMETFEVAITAAETGHLVFGTIHASSVPHVIGRLLDLYPTERHPILRGMLSSHLKAILCQRLLRGCTKEIPRVPAAEMMITNGSIQEAILKGEDGKILSIIKKYRDEGMIDFNTSLNDLVKRGLITKETALSYSPNQEALKMLLKGIATAEA